MYIYIYTVYIHICTCNTVYIYIYTIYMLPLPKNKYFAVCMQQPWKCNIHTQYMSSVIYALFEEMQRWTTFSWADRGANNNSKATASRRESWVLSRSKSQTSVESWNPVKISENDLFTTGRGWIEDPQKTWRGVSWSCSILMARSLQHLRCIWYTKENLVWLFLL